MNLADEICNLQCKYCGKDNAFSIGRKLYDDKRFYLKCSCGARCMISLSSNIELIYSWSN
jgi:hypothetical protein